ncbi:Nucleoporin protein Ndc1-Nup [Musa troglodytarum]|uniref:Nucleoporin protein Ndc1-Nup n=2 Tax=Musa troglodytarum TaxID=320322 RepID=A0A9E7JKG8_9LILI|nr:Nucleoporin protein Ndc1-Nup [Musa troglodytarum]
MPPVLLLRFRSNAKPFPSSPLCSLLSRLLRFIMSSSSLPDEVVKNRWLGFLIWQSIASAVIHLSSSLLLHRLGRGPSSAAAILFSFLAFHLSLLLLSLALFLLSTPHPDPSASLPDLAAATLRASLKSLVGGFSRPSFTADFAHRARRSLASGVFLLVCGVAGFLSVVAVCGNAEVVDGESLVGVGLRGLVFGLVYGLHYVYRRRWILKFPIIQRPLFYSFKIGLSQSLKRALKLSVQAYVSSVILIFFLPDQLKNKSMIGKFIVQQLRFYIGILTVSICWELSHHLLQDVHTRRCIFAPPQGSAAAETNPSEILLETLEQSSPRSLVQYLAYLDLCIVTESNAEPWRRAAFFEETGETYQRTINVCLRPIEQLASGLAEGLEGFSINRSDLLSKQLNSPVDIQLDSRLHEALNDFQICSWCARALGALTARSHSEDRYGVAQLTGCNKAVVSTLLSCLLAVEACVGKKTSAQLAHMLGPANIRWATVNTGKRDAVPALTSKKRGAALHAKAYAMADVLKTSMYQVVSAFQTDMQANAKASVLEKNWIAEGKPIYGTREILIQKLHLFLDYHAV